MRLTVPASPSVTISGTPAFNLAQVGGTTQSWPLVARLYGHAWASSFVSSGALAANTPETVFVPASNTNGAIVWRAMFAIETNTARPYGGFTAHTAAPTGIAQGSPICYIDTTYVVAGTVNPAAGKLEIPIFIPSGRGLYFIITGAVADGVRSVLYTLL